MHAIQERLRAAGVGLQLVGNLVGELKSSAVTPAARGQGIGSAMVRERLDYLRGQGCRYAVSASWVSNNGAHSSLGPLARAGFERVAAIPGYWAADQEAAGYLCEDCGAACTCTAIIMIHRFGS
ncbi:ribosomal protein S18 acetylase RimI-like enzyme [Arthrobacter sp. UYCo732]